MSIPTLYILAAIHVKNRTPQIKKKMDSKTCHSGGSKGSLAGINMGEKRGNIDPKMAIFPFGLLNTAGIITKASMTGIVMGNINCCPSARSSLTAAPTAANSDEYKK